MAWTISLTIGSKQTENNNDNKMVMGGNKLDLLRGSKFMYKQNKKEEERAVWLLLLLCFTNKTKNKNKSKSFQVMNKAFEWTNKKKSCLNKWTNSS